MNNFQTSPFVANNFEAAAAKITRRAASSVKADYFQPDCRLPLVIRPAIAGVELLAWARSNREFLEAHLLQEGAILFRDFDLKTTEEFEQLIETVSGKLLDYSYRSTPRTLVSGRSTRRQSIPPINQSLCTTSFPIPATGP